MTEYNMGYGTTGGAYVSCGVTHRGAYLEGLLKNPELNVGGATAYSLEVYADLVLDLTGGSYKPKREVVAFAKGSVFEDLRSFVDMPALPREVAYVDWTDYGTPHFKAEFWLRLYERAVSHQLKWIMFCCTGGHGRTGTAIASLLVGSGKITPYDAVKVVRAKYCKKAIESRKQEEYIWGVWETLYGAELPEKKLKKLHDRYSDLCDESYVGTNKVSKVSKLSDTGAAQKSLTKYDFDKLDKQKAESLESDNGYGTVQKGGATIVRKDGKAVMSGNDTDLVWNEKYRRFEKWDAVKHEWRVAEAEDYFDSDGNVKPSVSRQPALIKLVD